MKSVKLNVSIRNNIIKSMVDTWELNNVSTEKPEKLKNEVGDWIWNNCYSCLDFKNIPSEMLRMSSNISFCIGTEVKEYSMTEKRPVKMQNNYSQIPAKVFVKEPKIVKECNKKLEIYSAWVLKRNEFKEEITQIVNSVNTTKQLVELWPEAEQYLPAYANDPSKGINLPALKTSRLNEALGIQNNKD